MRRAHGLLALSCTALVALVALAAAADPAGEGGGFERFRAQQADAAKVAMRGKDWPAAEAAWNALLELDPRSLEALEGLADVAQKRADRDAEVLARIELDDALSDAIAAGDGSRARALSRSVERLAQIDPFPGEADALLSAYSEAQAELGRRYADEGFHANSLAAWQRRLRLCRPGSPEAEAASAAIADVLAKAPDAVARRYAPVEPPGGPDAAWIAEFDRKTAKWGSAGKWDTPHYRIKCNAGWRLGSDAARAMEQVHAFYREIWGIVPDPKPAKVPPGLREIAVSPIDINIFATRAEYVTRAGTGNEETDWTGGVFKGSEVDTYDHSTTGKGSKDTMQTLFHECSHQFMDVAVGDVPSFITEGVASLFEGIEVLSNGSIRRDLPVPHYLTPLADDIQHGRALPLRSVFNAPENKPELYKYRWGVMYFLRMYVDESGQYVFRDRLQDYIYDFKRGGVGDETEHFTRFVLQAVKAPGLLDFDAFEAAWQKWIVDLAAELKTADKRLDVYLAKGRSAGLLGQQAEALAWYEKALDIDADDPEALWGCAAACAELAQAAPAGPERDSLNDRAVLAYRQFVDLAAEDDPRRADGAVRAGRLDPEVDFSMDVRRSLAGGMAALAHKYDEEKMPRLTLRCAQGVLGVEPFDPSARALLARIERESGLSVVRWQRLFNGFDLDGWYAGEGSGSFFVDGGVLLNDSSRAASGKGGRGKPGSDKPGSDKPGSDKGAAPPPPAADGGITYQALLADRKVDGDFSFEARLQTGKDWQIVGLIFGARDTDHYEAIVLRNRPGTEKGPGGGALNNVDFGSFDQGAWTFRGDGSIKAEYDASAGVVLRLDVRGREVSVSIDGQPVSPIVGGQIVEAIKYPLGALRGDVGLLASRGVSRFSDIRLGAGAER